MRIKCVQCEQATYGPVPASMQARKVRTPYGWANVCDDCGASYPAPPPGTPYRRRQQRQIRRRQQRAELLGQLRLFPR